MGPIVRGASIAIVACLFLVGPAWALETCVQFSSGVQPSPNLPNYCQAGSFLALDVHHLLRRTGSGPKGRVLEDLVLRKRLDESSPGLWNLLDNQTSQVVTISFFAFNPASGQNELRAKLILDGARVVTVEPITPRDSGSIEDLERVRLQYDTITLEYKDGRRSVIGR